MTIEFTDRYGGNPPSWLRACHGDCEAMGWVPIEESTDDESDWPLWSAAHVAAGEHDCDGWHFVKHDACRGTGRVSWLTAIGRVPRWIVKGARFIPFAMSKEISSPSMTYWQRVRLAFYAAWGSDIKGLFR